MSQLIFLIKTVSPGVYRAEIPGIPEATVSATTLAGVIMGIQESWAWWQEEQRKKLIDTKRPV